MTMETTILKVEGAHCASCAYAIERQGRKLEGVREVRVYPGRRQVHVQHEAGYNVVGEMAAVVKRLGCHATVHDESSRIDDEGEKGDSVA